MTDVHNKETRSYNMSRIRGKDTKPEMVVRRFLFANGFRYRLHGTKWNGAHILFINPELIFLVAIEVLGVTWKPDKYL